MVSVKSEDQLYLPFICWSDTYSLRVSWAPCALQALGRGAQPALAGLTLHSLSTCSMPGSPQPCHRHHLASSPCGQDCYFSEETESFGCWQSPTMGKWPSKDDNQGRFLWSPVPQPKASSACPHSKNYFHTRFLKTLFISPFLPSKQFSSQTILIPGINSFKQNIAKQRKDRNPLMTHMGIDAMHWQRAEPLTSDCKQTQILEQKVQAGPEDKNDHLPWQGAGAALHLLVLLAVSLPDPYRQKTAILKCGTVFSENQL